jgi:hypothetical protein
MILRIPRFHQAFAPKMGTEIILMSSAEVVFKVDGTGSSILGISYV